MSRIKLNYSIRKKCVLSKNDKLKNFLSLKKFPVFIGCTSQKRNKDLFFDMDWSVGSKSGLIQLKKLIDPKKIYFKYHSEAVGEVWKKHHEEFSNFIIKYCDQTVLEMGGGANNLANICVKNSKIKNWFNFEIAKINKNQIKYNKKVKYVNKSINDQIIKKFVLNKTSFVHSHAIEHLYHPMDTLRKISRFKEIDKMIFSVPNLKKYLLNKYTNAINFEHTILMTEEVLKKMLNMINFKIVKKKYFRDHSIFIYAKKCNSISNYKLPNLKNYQVRYKNMINFYKARTLRMNKLFFKNNKRQNFLFGAHIFSQFLIYMGLKENNFKFIIDNSKQKQNKRLYGSELFVQKPEIIKKISNPLVLVNAGQYQKEVESQLKKINKTVQIIRL